MLKDFNNLTVTNANIIYSIYIKVEDEEWTKITENIGMKERI